MYVLTAATLPHNTWRLRHRNPMDSIDRLITILNTYTPGDPVVRITLSPIAWILLNSGDVEHQYISGGSDVEMLEPGGTGYGIVISIEKSQKEVFRLWDAEGREVKADSP